MQVIQCRMHVRTYLCLNPIETLKCFVNMDLLRNMVGKGEVNTDFKVEAKENFKKRKNCDI